MKAAETFQPEKAEKLSRPRAIEQIRSVLQALTDDERCACVIAGRYGLFCKGFARLSDQELRDHFPWISRRRPKATRQEIEALASSYHLGRQQVTGAAVCCDVETRDHCGCDGWNSFDNRTLERFVLELTGRPVHIE
jgi:hypothetical protein